MRATIRLNAFINSILILLLSAVLCGCSGTPGSTSSFSIGGMVSGLTGTGLVLQDNGGDNLTITAGGSFTFPTKVTGGKPFSVTVLTQPTTPAQTCTVTGGTGTANANVTTVVVTCTSGASGTVTIAGTVVNLSGTGLVLQDNGGDNLTITASGGFTFPTALTAGSMYVVTVFTQPTNPGYCPNLREPVTYKCAYWLSNCWMRVTMVTKITKWLKVVSSGSSMFLRLQCHWSCHCGGMRGTAWESRTGQGIPLKSQNADCGGKIEMSVPQNIEV